jgi:hypothetical protein
MIRVSCEDGAYQRGVSANGAATVAIFAEDF